MLPAPLELLAPARDAETGIAAIQHGADAVYIGGPAFGARAAAGNSFSDIARLAEFAHDYSARVLLALNTILSDAELEQARDIAWQAWEAGVDALIVQDMGLLELDLPPIALHASTQTDIRTPQKARFLTEVGFSQMVLARELSLPEIRTIAASTTATLEFFIHGALCVSYSGQCYLSHAQTGRSANRGECAQLCRLPYSLADGDGLIIARDQHLLSLKDNRQNDNLAALADAGIRSFKIEGRLKDQAYVKNITAYYRQQIDALIAAKPERYRRASAGRCRFDFTPAPEKSFHRGSTDYFVQGRQQDIAEFRSPKFAGQPVGRVAAIGRGHFDVDGDTVFHNGDGLAYFDTRGELQGLRINRAEGRRLYPAEMPRDLIIGCELLRNRDQEFERRLEKPSAERRIDVRLHFSETADGFALEMCDEEGQRALSTLAHPKQGAQHPEQAMATLRDQLGKLGATRFHAESINIKLSQAWFIPGSLINALRRDCAAALTATRRAAYRRPPRHAPVSPPARYPEAALSYLGNVHNAKARAFYARHGVELVAPSFESGEEKNEVPLMISRHCLRHAFNLCPKEVKGIKPDPLQLINGNERYTLRFDCKRCEMQVLGKLKSRRR